MRKLEREILRRRVGNKRLREVYHARHRPKVKKPSALRRAWNQLKQLFGGKR